MTHDTSKSFIERKIILQQRNVLKMCVVKAFMKHMILFLFIAVFATACSKSSETDSEILVRVKNLTNVNFTSVDAIQVSFGTINAGATTDYKNFKEVVAYPGANLEIGEKMVYAGLLYCGTPPLPMLENGRYTLEIYKDTLTYSTFNARYVKE